MKVVNFWGGPGSGKTTLSLSLTAAAKKRGMRAEFVPEAARDLIYDGVTDLSNQFFISALQHKRIERLQKAGAEIVFVDSPLPMQLMYAMDYNLPYYDGLVSTVEAAYKSFDNFNVFVLRVKPYNTFGRVQGTEDEAKRFDLRALSLFGRHMNITVTGDEEGEQTLIQTLFQTTRQQK